ARLTADDGEEAATGESARWAIRGMDWFPSTGIESRHHGGAIRKQRQVQRGQCAEDTARTEK
ncbi:MAG: hypothetical protein IJ521_09125, partial [Schwartzia sp.]|nr:hypothetical protein [Schwartzia sp. (in: firmicutes)]